MRVLLDYACKVVAILLFIVAVFILFLMYQVLLPSIDKDPLGEIPEPVTIIKNIWKL